MKAEKEQKRSDKLLKLADTLLRAATDVYESDDAFTTDSSREHAHERYKRDQALINAIESYRFARAQS